ncbi:MAG TPA: OB-fold nucleic acid binding domain-containing protein [Candidatus Nanoarchaeia archaeon]|nr:OB-fold nucleic acid binding domain-containing protein [Candidatus Nanoarchaeia archaeon]
MRENTLLKIALISSLAGLIILYFVSISLEVPTYSPVVTNKIIGQDVKLKGIVSSVSKSDNVVFIEVAQQNPIAAVAFSAENLKISENDEIEILGNIQEYNGNLEVIADRIRVIK